jgi:hypothetical protein
MPRIFTATTDDRSRRGGVLIAGGGGVILIHGAIFSEDGEQCTGFSKKLD